MAFKNLNPIIHKDSLKGARTKLESLQERKPVKHKQCISMCVCAMTVRSKAKLQGIRWINVHMPPVAGICLRGN